MDRFKGITEKLPEPLAKALEALPAAAIGEVEEIRLRCGQPVRLQCGIRERVLNQVITEELMNQTLNSLIQYSYYAYEEDLAKGFVTIEGGHRVGVCGKAVMRQGQIGLLKEVSSLNIRFAREIIGCSTSLIAEILEHHRPVNTLVVSPPGCGKTTLLRDMARALSENRYKVAICDERSELAGMYRGKPSFQLGPRCDVLDGCEKGWGIPMLIRSMSPQVIIADEIGKPEDIAAVRQCLVSGVTLITSIHGSCIEDLERSAIGSLVKQGVFKRLIYLTNAGGVGTIGEIIRVGGEQGGVQVMGEVTCCA